MQVMHVHSSVKHQTTVTGKHVSTSVINLRLYTKLYFIQNISTLTTVTSENK